MLRLSLKNCWSSNSINKAKPMFPPFSSFTTFQNNELVFQLVPTIYLRIIMTLRFLYVLVSAFKILLSFLTYKLSLDSFAFLDITSYFTYHLLFLTLQDNHKLTAHFLPQVWNKSFLSHQGYLIFCRKCYL